MRYESARSRPPTNIPGICKWNPHREPFETASHVSVDGHGPRATLERLFLTCYEHALITTALKDMYAFQDSDRVGTQKKAAPKWLQRDESDVEKLVACFTSGMMINLFQKTIPWLTLPQVWLCLPKH